eukprot:CAMPEP_0173121204 /NCGR_PEP_ID=MMETSP1102-20130122/53134_1 /TAXON_ID=49646 /ORGANISM="Geminigera sp., Strain Caron Lab Isolate" /LENGTH=140 /DNA_ID=CAMNT_0014027741 /DNA_START=35 /DNA_END=457 /DNA_ORIENTATION=+
MPTMSRYNSTAALPAADDSSVSSVSRASSSSSLSSMASTVASPFASLILKSPETTASATAALAGGTMRRTNSATSLADAAKPKTLKRSTSDHSFALLHSICCTANHQAMRAVVERENQSLRDFEKSFVMAARTSDWDNGI